MNWLLHRLGLAESLPVPPPTDPANSPMGAPLALVDDAVEEPPPVEPAPVEPIPLSATRLDAYFNNNAVAASAAFNGRSVRLNGMVARVDRDRDHALVYLTAGRHLHYVACVFTMGTEGVASLVTGDLLELDGVVREARYGVVTVDGTALHMLASA